MSGNALEENILNFRGGIAKNNLLEILKHADDLDTTVYHAAESPYIDIENAQEYFTKFKNRFTVLNLNIQSLNAKFETFVTFLDELASSGFYFSVIALQETWVTSNLDIKNFSLPDYSTVSLNATCSSHGGLVVYINKNFKYKTLDVYTATETWEGIFVDISAGGLPNNVTICNIYRPPRDLNNQLENFLKSIGPVLHNLALSRNNMLFCGDLNIDLLKVDTRTLYYSYMELLYSFSFLPCITLPTRLSRRSASLIDHIFYKSLTNETVDGGIVVSSMSDHFMTFVALPFKTQHQKPPNRISIQTNNDAAIQTFSDAIRNCNIFEKLNKNMTSDPNENYDILKYAIQENIEKQLPLKNVKFHKHKIKNNPWVTFGIIRSIKTRDKIYKQLKTISPDGDEYVRLKLKLITFNRILKKTIREAKISYYNNLFLKCKSDSKKTWNIINSVLRSTKNKKNISKIFVIDNMEISNEQEIAEHFNQFFSSIGHKQASTLQNSTHHFSYYLKSATDTCFNFSHVSPENVKTIINKFKPKSSAGDDNLSVKVLKCISDTLS